MLVSAKYQHESAMGIHMSPPSWISHPSLSPSHPSRLLEPRFEFPESYSKFPLALYFTYGNVSFHVQFSTVQLLSCVLLFVTPLSAVHQASRPSPTPESCSNSRLSSQWCHPTISSSDIPFSSCLQSFPASGSFPVSQFFASDGQSIGASASASVLPMNIQGWFPLGLTGLVSLQSKGLSKVFSNTTVQNHQFFSAQLSY